MKKGNSPQKAKNTGTPVSKSAIAEREERILAFWQKNGIFEKTLEKNDSSGKKSADEFIFYDGPPFATGEPHYGHILAGTIKDAIPRYKTMRGFYVPRRWGWDCHGLPIENMIEKELGLSTRKDIELYGIEKFNAAARASVLRYDAVWKRIVPRTGRFVDMDNAYLTMDWRYTESIWWSFKRLHEQGLVYQGFKPMHICPRCETTLSNFEVGLNYKEISDISAYVKFELVDEGGKGTGEFLLAWTTTPWTLPGNVALAVNPKMTYVQALVESEKGKESVLLAKDRLQVLKNPHTVQKEFSGTELLGKKYRPLFPYYQKADIKNKENFYKVVGAHFVTTTDGTGIVHIAPGFGEDDYNLSLTEKLPFIQPVGMDGRYTKEVTDFAGEQVKPIPTSNDPKAHQKTDVEIIKYLDKKGLLFAKEQFKHSYPHCWRCDTPLLNYAASSWFVQVTALKEKLLAKNRGVHWVPAEIGQGRFGNWLENAKDWSVSRSRFWGAPLPVWQCADCGHNHFIGSVDELRQKTKRNRYFVMRHGEAESNVANVISADIKDEDPLTPHGRKQVQEAAQHILANSNPKIDLIFSSPFERTRQTAELVAEVIKYDGKITYDDRLRELGSFSFEGKSRDDRNVAYEEHLGMMAAGDETREGAQHRVKEFLYDIDAKHAGKTILIVSHAGPLLTFGPMIMDNAEVREAPFASLPHDAHFELDLHRPYIDAITFSCEKCGGTAKRVQDVFDTWYESGSMPFASIHFPFENEQKSVNVAHAVPPRFPADFIAEGQDQTRGWFYSLLVLGCGLFEQSPYKNVVVNGTILAEDGQKMSKRLKNYPDVEDVLNKYGADAMRYYLLSSPAVAAEDVAFTEKGLDEVVKKIINRLENVYAFYALYQEPDQKKAVAPADTSKHILDRWILARLRELSTDVTAGLEHYKLDAATRPFAQFVDDLSTWYLRRSRDRFKNETEKEDKHAALATTRFVLFEIAKLLAPIMPFLAEELYQKVKTAADLESVHLETWPVLKKHEKDPEVLADMNSVRSLVSLALEARAAAGIKIRQPLAELSIADENIARNAGLAELIADEVNVKKISSNSTIAGPVQLDTTITPELKIEGAVRDFIRSVQDIRKNAGLTPNQHIKLGITTSAEGEKIITAGAQEIKNTVRAKEIVFGQVAESIPGHFEIDGIRFDVGLKLT
jgi:isoleucyl-tRNA synthetase